MAATAWQDHRARWRVLGDNLDDGLELTAFSLDLPDTPRKAWASIRNALGEVDHEHKYQDELYDASQLLWRLMALSTIHAIWCSRHGLRLEEGATLATLRAIIIRTVLSGVMQPRPLVQEFDDCASPRSRVLSALAMVLVQAHVNDASECPRPLVARRVDLLFFKGGLRGNPGPGGAGSVIVWLDTDTHAAELRWATSMSYGSTTTTNNTAEYWGLVHGLRGLHSAPCYQESAITIRQLRHNRPPKSISLRMLYKPARHCADSLGVLIWTHYYRDFNKMADRAANIDMDSSRSIQTSPDDDRPVLADLVRFLVSDVGHWTSTHRHVRPDLDAVFDRLSDANTWRVPHLNGMSLVYTSPQ